VKWLQKIIAVPKEANQLFEIGEQMTKHCASGAVLWCKIQQMEQFAKCLLTTHLLATSAEYLLQADRCWNAWTHYGRIMN